MKYAKIVLTIVAGLVLNNSHTIFSMRASDEDSFDSQDYTEQSAEENSEEMPPAPNQPRKKKRFTKKLTAVLTGKAPIKTLWSKEAGRFSFTNLPKDIQMYIMQLLIMNQNAKTLTQAIKTIHALTLVNHEFHDEINNPANFGLLLNSLSIRFNKSLEEVASFFPIKAAHDYLMMFLDNLDESDRSQLRLLSNPNINVNIKDSEGNTPLIKAVAEGSLDKVIFLTRNDILNIDAQNNEGNTALHILFFKIENTNDPAELATYMKIAGRLLTKRANSSIPNNNGIKPKHLAIQISNLELNNMIRISRLNRNI